MSTSGNGETMDERTKDLELSDELSGAGGSTDPDSGDVEILSIEGAEEPGPTTFEATEGSELELERLRRDLEELRGRSLRTLADFDNFRKRAEREREESRRFALMEAIRELLPVVDNLERAAAAQGSLEDLRLGVEMTLRQLRELLGRFGLTEVPAVGSRFDPHVHEAVMREVRSGVEEPTVVSEFLRGYLLNERVLRPAMVVVAVPPEGDGNDGQPPPAAPAAPAVSGD